LAGRRNRFAVIGTPTAPGAASSNLKSVILGCRLPATRYLKAIAAARAWLEGN
jgi:hypothetical protein